jgi:pimeloyl-ACP methyl ester carboxylesterase
MTPEPVSRDVSLRGLRFHFVDWGGDGALPVLFLHGFSGHARTWDHAAGTLHDRFHVLALDQRGHGDTEWADEYGSGPMVADVLAFLDALALERVALVGASMGGINAYCFAAAHPERVDRLVVVDVGPEIDRRGISRIMANAVANTKAGAFASVDEAFARMRDDNPLADPAMLRHRVEHNVRTLPDGRVTWKWDPALADRSAARSEIGHDEQWDRWRGLRCPTLLLRGSESDLLSVETAERMLAEQPRARLVTIDGASHTVTMDRPDAHDAAIREFLLAAV